MYPEGTIVYCPNGHKILTSKKQINQNDTLDATIFDFAPGQHRENGQPTECTICKEPYTYVVSREQEYILFRHAVTPKIMENIIKSMR